MPAMPRPLVGLAAAALAAGLLSAPLVAYAKPTSTPTPKVSVASTSTPSPSASTHEETEKTSPSATASPSSDESLAKDVSESPSPDPPDSEADETSSGSHTGLAGTASDGVKSRGIPAPTPTPTTEATPSDPLRAQAVAPAAISLTKSASRKSVSKVGQVITYRFMVANTGTVALANIEITDELDGLSGPSCPQTGLQPGEAMTCTATLRITQDWLDFGDIDNSATVFGNIVGDDNPEVEYRGANASAHVAVDQRPSIALDASVSPTGTADAGDRLRYRATATNTGNVTLTAARITSSLDALDLDCGPSTRATLAPGDSISCTGSYKVSNADARRGRVTNTLTARAEPPYGDTSTRSDDVTDVTRLRVAVHKSAGDGSDRGLADTGGPDGTLPVGVLGVAALIAGAGLLRRGLRS